MRLIAFIAALAVAGPAFAAAPDGPTPAPAPAGALGEKVFRTRCQGCHEPAVGRAPGRAELAARPQADIVTAMTAGVMAPMSKGLSAEELDAVAVYLTQPGAPRTAGDIERRMLSVPPPPLSAEPHCAAGGAPNPGESDWAAMGRDDASRRFQPHPGLTKADLPRLKLKWAFAMSGGGQPTVVGDWLFTTNRSGRFYALDAKTGCVRWSLDGVVSRTTPPVIRSSASPSGWLTLAGLSGRVVLALDAANGKTLWRSDVLEAHPVSVLTGAPVVSGDRVFVPISSIEEAAAMNKAYPCCTFRGSLAALDLKTGRTLWRSYVITEPQQTLRPNAAGVAMKGPAGAAIWSAPTVDPKRGLVYVVTGDSYTDVETAGADAIFAFDMATGAMRWRRQVTQEDNFVMGCKAPGVGNCPSPMGPDYDFGASPVLMKTARGDVLAAGQKSGLVYGLSPDTGTLLWTTRVGVGSALGGIEWGIGGDAKTLYVPVSDVGVLFQEARVDMSDAGAAGKTAESHARSGLYALNPANGKILWSAPSPKAPCVYAAASDRRGPTPCIRAQSAAPAVMPGVVFSGTMDGWMRAYDAADGKVLWAYSTTAQKYDTINGVKGQPGGSIDGMGPTIAGGMVYFMSGFNGAAHIGANGTNVLLAFGLDPR